MTPAEVLERHTSAELSEWIAYETLEPWGDYRILRAGGRTAWVTAASQADPKKFHSTELDFVLTGCDPLPPPPKTAEQINSEAVAALNALFPSASGKG